MTALTWIHRMVALALLSVSALTLTACNTMEGAGRDVERGGEALQDAADDAKR